MYCKNTGGEDQRLGSYTTGSDDGLKIMSNGGGDAVMAWCS